MACPLTRFTTRENEEFLHYQITKVDKWKGVDNNQKTETFAELPPECLIRMMSTLAAMHLVEMVLVRIWKRNWIVTPNSHNLLLSFSKLFVLCCMPIVSESSSRLNRKAGPSVVVVVS